MAISELKYRLVRSRRKTLALIVESDGSLTVRAPLHARLAQVEQVITQQAEWIRKKQAWVRSQPIRSRPRLYANGEPFFYLGQEYPLRLVEGQKPSLVFEKGEFHLTSEYQSQGQSVFQEWYRAQARQVIGERTARLAGQLGYTYSSLRITSARTRWGSCSSRGRLSFSWRLVMTPFAAIDYVIVHELVHLEIRNHSPAFWQRLARLSPGYQEQVRWLKQNATRLAL